MAAIFKDGRQKGFSQTAPEVHQLILDTWDIMLTKNYCWIYSANWYRNMVWLMGCAGREQWLLILSTCQRLSDLFNNFTNGFLFSMSILLWFWKHLYCNFSCHIINANIIETYFLEETGGLGTPRQTPSHWKLSHKCRQQGSNLDSETLSSFPSTCLIFKKTYLGWLSWFSKRRCSFNLIILLNTFLVIFVYFSYVAPCGGPVD